ncbi:MAG TPA: 50S ribosomal protein L15 [Saprospiraceae bacterium]|nr:50S ribosomal protein L15 [Saprospiraceae bacterium]
MELHNLTPAPGSIKKGKRIARGQGSGHGGTSTKGHKGQQSRSGYSKKRHHEGGQMPLQMRIPKVGFNSPNKTYFVGINLDQLQSFATKNGVKTVTLDLLRKTNYIKKRDLVKILGRGELTDSVAVEAHAVSASARSAIEGKGGIITIVQ